MDAESAGTARSRLLESMPSRDGESAAQILAAYPTVDVVRRRRLESDRVRLGSVTMLAAGEVESERGSFGVVAGTARRLPPME
jgi:hypothetical protein